MRARGDAGRRRAGDRDAPERHHRGRRHAGRGDGRPLPVRAAQPVGGRARHRPRLPGAGERRVPDRRASPGCSSASAGSTSTSSPACSRTTGVAAHHQAGDRQPHDDVVPAAAGSTPRCGRSSGRTRSRSTWRPQVAGPACRSIVTVRSPWAVAASFKRLGWGFDAVDLHRRLTAAGRPPSLDAGRPRRPGTRSPTPPAHWSSPTSTSSPTRTPGAALRLVDLDDIVEQPLATYEALYRHAGLPLDR